MSAINLYTSKTSAFYFRDSQINRFYEFGGVQLIPNIAYTQNTNGIILDNTYTSTILKAIDNSVVSTISFTVTKLILGGVAMDSETLTIDNIVVTIDYGSQSEYYWSITPTIDCSNDLVYLKFTNGTNTYYTNPFYITILDEDRVTKFTYKSLSSYNYESIGLKTWFRQKSKQTELTTYYESSTGRTVTQGIKTKSLEMYESEFMSMEDLIMTAKILESPFLYIGSARYYLFETVKIPELTQQENFGKIKFTLALNN